MEGQDEVQLPTTDATELHSDVLATCGGLRRCDRRLVNAVPGGLRFLVNVSCSSSIALLSYRSIQAGSGDFSGTRARHVGHVRVWRGLGHPKGIGRREVAGGHLPGLDLGQRGALARADVLGQRAARAESCSRAARSAGSARRPAA